MKNCFKLLIAAMLLVLCLTGCAGNWAPPYEGLNQSGYTVSVRFDAGDGVFAGTNDVYIVDVFSMNNVATAPDGSIGFYLLSPDDPLREEGAFSVSRTGYFLAGWYTERSPRVNEQGEPLDDYGVKTAESGRPQGYTYAGKWDFDQDFLKVQPNGDYSAENPVCTLYAAWIPYFNYEIYAPAGDETSNFQLLGTVQSIDLVQPTWSEKTGRLDMEKFPDPNDRTFEGAFLDAALTQPMPEKILGSSLYVDYETGTTSTAAIPIYTTWMDGTWFKISKPSQLLDNGYLDGNYILCADLDFSDEVWPPLFAKGRFTGKILGNGYSIKNVNILQSDVNQQFGGLFGALDAGAELNDVHFENITYTLSSGSRKQAASFGLLCGSLSSDAVLQDVTVTGELLISENCYPLPSYLIGLLCGSGEGQNVDLSGISCRVSEDSSEMITVTVDENGAVTIEFKN